MADARHRFVPTAAQPQTAVRPLIRTGTAWVLVLGAAALIGRPFFRPSAAGDPSARFGEHRVEFRLLKDMILAEPTVTSVGPDNVREYWLFDGRWSSPRQPGRFLSRGGMLEAVELSPARYEAYLDVLESVGGYRAVRSGSGSGARVTVHLFSGPKGAAARLVYDPVPSSRRDRWTDLGENWFLEAEGD